MKLNRAKFHYGHFYPDMNLVLGPYVVWQTGDLQCEPGYIEEKHVQVVHEISFIVAGHGWFMLNDAEYPVKKGDLIINRVGDTHMVISSQDDPLRYYYLGFDFRQPITSEVILRIKYFWAHFAIPVFSNAFNLQETFIDFLSEISTDDFLAAPLMEGYVNRIICEVYRQFNRNQNPKYLLREDQTMDEKLVYDILQYLETSGDRLEHLAELCQTFGYSYSHIAGRFKAVVGESLNAYCQRRRFERAQGNLRRGMSITEVAEAAGFKSIHAFSRAYKHHCGVAPSQYKESYRLQALDLLSPAASSITVNAPARLNVAVIGCGDIAHTGHIPQYLRHPQANLVYLCDINPLRSLEAVRRYRAGAAVTDYRVVLRDADIDAVSLCTPNDLHVSLALEFMAAGKAVLCETPPSRALDGLLEMQRAMVAGQKTLMVATDNRYYSAAGIIRQMILGGQLGNVYHVYISFRKHRAIPGLGTASTTRSVTGGGVLMDQGFRYLDTALYCLSNPKPMTVSANTFCRLGRNIREYAYETLPTVPPKLDGVYDVEDSLSALIRTEGPTLTLNGAWAQNIDAEEMFIDFMGTKAGVRYRIGQDFVVYSTENGALVSFTPTYAKADPFNAQINQFIANAQAKACPENAMIQTVSTMRLVQAIYDSAAQGREISC